LRRFLLRWAINVLGVLAAAALLPRDIQYDSAFSVAIFALILGFLNAFVRPILILFTLPLTLITLGLFTLIVNVLMFWLTATFPIGVRVSDFRAAFIGALLVTVISFFVSLVVDRRTPS
jgi:putative membrane protein